jgi:sulfite reductase (NADPH) flavoprotein alpha-component
VAWFHCSGVAWEQIYIQHKIVEDAAHIVNYLKNHEGHFYLCGPTWPVPDVRRAICDGLIAEAGMSQEGADQFLDALKEDARYVLEVY